MVVPSLHTTRDRAVVIAFTPLHLVIGEVNSATLENHSHPVPLLHIPAVTTPNKNLSDIIEPPVDATARHLGAIVWRHRILDREAFRDLLVDAFDSLCYPNRSECRFVLVWKDHYDTDTFEYIREVAVKWLGFSDTVLIPESQALLQYHTEAFADTDDCPSGDSRDSEYLESMDLGLPRLAGEYAITNSQRQSSLHVPSAELETLRGLADQQPRHAGTIIHLGIDGLTAFAFAHGGILGRVRSAHPGLAGVNLFLSDCCHGQSQPPLSSKPSLNLTELTNSEFRLVQIPNAVKVQQVNFSDSLGCALRSNYSDARALPRVTGEVFYDPETIPMFFTLPAKVDLPPTLLGLARRPSLVTLIKSVSHEAIPFDLADQLLRSIFLSGALPPDAEFAARLSQDLRELRAEEMRQSKAATKDREASSSLARSWHLSSISIDHLDEKLMDVQIDVFGPLDGSEGILTVG